MRDRRSILLSFIFPLLAPALIATLMYLVGKTGAGGEIVREISVAVEGQANAPGLAAYLAEKGVHLVGAPEGRAAQEAAVRSGALSLVLLIPEDAQNSPVYELHVIVDRTNPRSTADSAELMRHVLSYSRLQAARLMQEQGFSPTMVTPVTAAQVNVGAPPNTAYLFYNMIPPLLTFMIFMGAVYLTIDTTVGERERGSIEPLMSTPVARWELLLGKALAALLFTAAVVIVNLLAFRGFMWLALIGSEGLAPLPRVGQFLGVFVTAIPLMALAVSIQVGIASITRSTKEAQIYLGLLPVLPLMPGVVMVFSPAAPNLFASSVPIFGQLMLFGQWISDKPVNPLHLVISAVFTLVTAAVVFYGASRLYERERMIFGT